MKPQPIEIEAAAEIASAVALMRYFPRKDPAALAAVAEIIRQECASEAEAQAVVDATSTNGNDIWTSAGAFREFTQTIVDRLRSRRPAPAARPTSPTPAADCPQCPFITPKPLKPSERKSAIAYAAANCPQCPRLTTGRLLAEEDTKDRQAAATIKAMPEEEREQLRERAAKVYRDYHRKNPDSIACTEPYLSANIRRLMIAEVRKRAEPEPQKRGKK